MFQKVKSFFADRPNLTKLKLSMVEVFSSPTNQGQMYACVVNGHEGPEGQRLSPDPFEWEYRYLGSF